MNVLLEKAQSHIKALKAKGFVVDCWSTKQGDGTSTGIATEDCDIAIDVKGIHSEIDHPHDKLVYNPYGKEMEHPDFSITRIKIIENAA